MLDGHGQDRERKRDVVAIEREDGDLAGHQGPAHRADTMASAIARGRLPVSLVTMTPTYPPSVNSAACATWRIRSSP